MLGVYAMLHVAAVIISAALDLESEAALVFEPEKGTEPTTLGHRDSD